ncbi:MAG: hypothetical protein RL141_966 [Candidatus Parcubacteria bacterium]|jgi:3D (Asp-Asp-Asp) domain-containing protein
MTNMTSLIYTAPWKRLTTVSVLVAAMIASVPVSAVADEDHASTNAPVVEAAEAAPVPEQKVVTPVPKAFVVPAEMEDAMRVATTGHKVVKIYKNVPSTAYTSRPEETDDSPFIAADGTHVYDGMVAANFLKFGTKIRIPELYGDKVFTVHDRMNKRYHYKVDLWMENLQDARNHGLRTVTIEVIEPVEEETA